MHIGGQSAAVQCAEPGKRGEATCPKGMRPVVTIQTAAERRMWPTESRQT